MHFTNKAIGKVNEAMAYTSLVMPYANKGMANVNDAPAYTSYVMP